MINYKAEVYRGTMVGRYNHRLGVQITATDSETKKRRYVFQQYNGYRRYKTPTLKVWEGVAHYKSGLNAHDSERLADALEFAEKEAKRLNEQELRDNS